MSIKVVVGRPQSLGAVTSTSGRMSTTSSGGLTVGSSVSRTRSIEDIQDIDISQRVDGAVLVYDEASGKYQIRELPTGSVDDAVQDLLLTGNVTLEGGTF